MANLERRIRALEAIQRQGRKDGKVDMAKVRTIVQGWIDEAGIVQGPNESKRECVARAWGISTVELDALLRARSMGELL